MSYIVAVGPAWSHCGRNVGKYRHHVLYGGRLLCCRRDCKELSDVLSILCCCATLARRGAGTAWIASGGDSSARRISDISSRCTQGSSSQPAPAYFAGTP